MFDPQEESQNVKLKKFAHLIEKCMEFAPTAGELGGDPGIRISRTNGLSVLLVAKRMAELSTSEKAVAIGNAMPNYTQRPNDADAEEALRQVALSLTDEDYVRAFVKDGLGSVRDFLPIVPGRRMVEAEPSFFSKFGLIKQALAAIHSELSNRSRDYGNGWKKDDEPIFNCYLKFSSKNRVELPASKREVLGIAAKLPNFSPSAAAAKVRCAFALSDSPKEAFRFVSQELASTLSDEPQALLAFKRECELHPELAKPFNEAFEGEPQPFDSEQTFCLKTIYSSRRLAVDFGLSDSVAVNVAISFANAERSAVFASGISGLTDERSAQFDDDPTSRYFFSTQESVEFARKTIDSFRNDFVVPFVRFNPPSKNGFDSKQKTELFESFKNGLKAKVEADSLRAKLDEANPPKQSAKAKIKA